ncbi:MAG: prepilin peptidase [Pseudobutyrivibrio sp.]|nr:prepilin peptidase [Pseudobutyrivibrio sp.]
MKYIILLLILGICTYTDIKGKYINMMVVGFGGLVGVVWNVLSGEMTVSAMLAGMILGVLLLIFSIISKEKIGMGDAMMVIITGIYLGIRNTTSLVFFSTLLAGILGMLFIKIKNKEIGYELPFAPFLFAVYIIGLFATMSGTVS